MKRSRFRSAVRSVLDYIGEGLIWSGLMWSGYPWDETWDYPDRPSGAPLSDEESDEWAALLRRLR